MASSRFFESWPGDPWAELGRLRRELDEAFGRTAPGGLETRRGNLYPPVNLYETSDGYVLTAEVPGLRPEDFEVSVEGSRVTLRGERKIDYPEPASLHRRERAAGLFRRTFELPVPADPDKTQAVYRHGVLMLRIAKAAEHQPRRISVQGS
jgi:HSP20 family protein